jgi:small-conductance mechanosensitive channel
MPANRIAALSGALAAVAAALVTILGAVDTTGQAIVMSVALIAVAVVVAVFLRGSQSHERHQAQANAAHRDEVAGALFIAGIEDPEADDVPLEDLPDDDEELAAPPPLQDGPGRSA